MPQRNRHSTCHMCRRDRDHGSCLGCPRYSRRNWAEAREMSYYGVFLVLLVLILIEAGRL